MPKRKERTIKMFRKAEKKKAKLRLAITGVAGSGKTYGALKVAQGLGDRIAMNRHGKRFRRFVFRQI